MTEIVNMPKRKSLNWISAIVFGLFHVGAIAALFMFSWRDLAVALFLYWMATGLGISLGYHRLHTHRSYKVPLGLEYFFAVCGALTLEGGPIFWVATHRIHHQKSDQPGDPHSPQRRRLLGARGLDSVRRSQSQQHAKLMSKYAPDLGEAPFLRLAEQLSLGSDGCPRLCSCLRSAALPMMLWGVCLRVVFGLHATWLVNSATHMWGRRRFATRDDSRNNWWVALITFGEGWHNNHHAHPTSARHGLAWYEFDPSWISLKVLKFFGVAKGIKVAKVTSTYAEREAA